MKEKEPDSGPVDSYCEGELHDGEPHKHNEAPEDPDGRNGSRKTISSTLRRWDASDTESTASQLNACVNCEK